MKMFFDTEFTELSRNAQLISIGIVSEQGDEFYWEFNDFDKDTLSEWVKENVVERLRYNESTEFTEKNNSTEAVYRGKGSKEQCKIALIDWFDKVSQSKNEAQIEIWADVPAWDWMLFCDIFGNAFSIPKNVHYICRDLATLLVANGYDPDLSRKDFVNADETQHNALSDAIITLKCYQKINK